jgi:hypothetical protein
MNADIIRPNFTIVKKIVTAQPMGGEYHSLRVNE